MSDSTTKATPRLCHIVKRDDFDGYGFNLHAEKGRPGQYIGKVDPGSPAEAAGLRQGDRILEVNDVDIGTESHKQVVERIKAVPNETRLLVVDPNPAPTPAKAEANGRSSNPTPAASPTPVVENGVQNNGNHNGDAPATPAVESRRPSTPPSTPTAPKSMNNNGNVAKEVEKIEAAANSSDSKKPVLNLSGMTAAEMRAKLAAKKKYDPKSESVDLRKKYEIIQKM